MVQIVFYEKPGCVNNTRQKQILENAGHTVIAKNLLTEDWSGKPGQLREFFGDRPVSAWFNRSAPAIKSGRVEPDSTSADQAIALMLADPLLIRRPLLQINGEKAVGFDEAYLEQWIGLEHKGPGRDLESCPKTPIHEL